MKIYFAGAGGKQRYEMLFRNQRPCLFSYYAIVTHDHGFGEHHRFNDATGGRARAKVVERKKENKKNERPEKN